MYVLAMSLYSLLNSLMHSRINKMKVSLSLSNFMYQLIFKKQVQGLFPNVEIALRMYLVLVVSKFSAKRSFSKLKLIKNWLRTSMCNDRLSRLALMSIEADILREINFEDVVTKSFTA